MSLTWVSSLADKADIHVLSVSLNATCFAGLKYKPC